MRKLIYRLAAYCLEKQFKTGVHDHGTPYSEWCLHCQATEVEKFLNKLL